MSEPTPRLQAPQPSTSITASLPTPPCRCRTHPGPNRATASYAFPPCASLLRLPPLLPSPGRGACCLDHAQTPLHPTSPPPDAYPCRACHLRHRLPQPSHLLHLTDSSLNASLRTLAPGKGAPPHPISPDSRIRPLHPPPPHCLPHHAYTRLLLRPAPLCPPSRRQTMPRLPPSPTHGRPAIAPHVQCPRCTPPSRACNLPYRYVSARCDCALFLALALALTLAFAISSDPRLCPFPRPSPPPCFSPSPSPSP